MGIRELIHPSLSQVRSDLRKDFMRRARRTPLDVAELLGTAAALVAALVAAERHSALGVLAAVAAILLILVRHTHRGLRQAMESPHPTRQRDLRGTP